MVPSEPYAVRSLRVSNGCGELRNALTALATLCPFRSTEYKAAPGGRRWCGGEDFSSGCKMKSCPNGEYSSFCIAMLK